MRRNISVVETGIPKKSHAQLLSFYTCFSKEIILKQLFAAGSVRDRLFCESTSRASHASDASYASDASRASHASDASRAIK